MSLKFSLVFRYAVKDECHLLQSTTLSAHTCKNIGGTYVAANRTCYYHEYSCPYYNVGGQCHPNVLCDAFSCDTCHLYGGYHEPNTGWYVHALYTAHHKTTSIKYTDIAVRSNLPHRYGNSHAV